MDLRDAAQELYAVTPPRDFTAERTVLVRKAKDAGQKDLAKEIGNLPKPAAAPGPSTCWPFISPR